MTAPDADRQERAVAMQTAMRRPEWWMLILSGIGLVLVMLQIRDGRESTREQLENIRVSVSSDAYLRLTSRMFDLDKAFFDHPEFRPYFYSGQVMPATADSLQRAKLEIMAEWVADMYDNVLRHRNVMDEETYAEWRRYMKRMYATGPALRSFLTAECTWYNSLYQELAGAGAPCAAHD